MIKKAFRNNTRKPNHEAATCMLNERQQIQGLSYQITTRTKLRQLAATSQKVHSLQYTKRSIKFFWRSVTIQDSHEIRAWNYAYTMESTTFGMSPRTNNDVSEAPTTSLFGCESSALKSGQYFPPKILQTSNKYTGSQL